MEHLLANLPLLMGLPESGAGAGAPGGQMVSLLITFGLIIVIFYFLIIRPQSRKQKNTQRMISSLKKGDKVATVGGIRGVVTAVKEDAVTVKVDDNTKLEFNKSAITSVNESKENIGESSEGKKS